MDERGVSRVYYVDWLRILAVLLLFPFHTWPRARILCTSSTRR